MGHDHAVSILTTMTLSSPIAAADIPKRCSACGQPLASPAPKSCPLCGRSFSATVDEGENDVTPFAQSLDTGESGWWRMCGWVWSAHAGRLKHLALLEPSAASRHFARTNLFIFSLLVAAIEWTRAGWLWLPSAFSGNTPARRPAGSGWMLIGRSNDAPLAPHLWWNPAEMLIGVAATFVAALIGLSLVSWLFRGMVSAAHSRAPRGHGRMGAAIFYGSAWGFWLAPAALLVLIRPVFMLAEAKRWSFTLTGEWLWLVAGVLAGFGLVPWWFWLVRLGATAPQHVRGRVVTVTAVGAPLVAGLALAAWWGWERVLGGLFAAFGLTG